MSIKFALKDEVAHSGEPVVFFSDGFPRVSAEEVLYNNLSIEHQPFEYNSNSPTPGDPYALRVGRAAGSLSPNLPFGVGYKEAAQTYMDTVLDESADAFGLDEEYYRAIQDEIAMQHGHRVDANTTSMDIFKHALQSVESFSRDDAELIMRVRAGVSSVEEPALMLAAVPDMGGFEAMKATRPLKKSELWRADMMFLRDLRQASIRSDSPIRNLKTYDNSPYRYSVLNEDNILVSKRLQASMDIGRRSLQVISRESFIGLPETERLDGVEPNLRKIGRSVVNLMPIDITKYYRIAKDTNSEGELD